MKRLGKCSTNHMCHSIQIKYQFDYYNLIVYFSFTNCVENKTMSYMQHQQEYEIRWDQCTANTSSCWQRLRPHENQWTKDTVQLRRCKCRWTRCQLAGRKVSNRLFLSYPESFWFRLFNTILIQMFQFRFHFVTFDFTLRLEKTLTHSQFVDLSDDDSDEDQIIETDEELRKFFMCSKFKHRSMLSTWLCGWRLQCN